MLGKKNLDELSPASRDYYERALMKMSLSLVFAAFGFFFLGLAAKAGGLSSGYGSFAVSNLVTSDMEDAYNAQSSGFGFACFAYVVCFLISSAASIYLSPLLIGTPNESKMLKSPQNIEADAGASAPPLAHAEATYTGYPSKI